MNSMVCLVSGQAMANAIPVLMYKPGRVHLLATPQEENRANYLRELFAEKGIAVEMHSGIDAYNTSGIAEVCRNIISGSGRGAALNVTGGTKLMALEAFRVFSEAGNTILYCDTVHKQMITLSPERHAAPITLQLSIHDYLAAHGYTITAAEDYTALPGYEPILHALQDNLVLSEFTEFAKKARPKLKDDRPSWNIQSKNRDFTLQKTPGGLVLRFNSAGGTLTIKDGAYKFIDGGWLEHLVLSYLTRILRVDALMGVKIKSPNGIENEIDALLLHDYTLHLISCKSGKYEPGEANKALYEVETLRALAGGTFGKAAAVFAETTPAFEKRAKELNITPVNIHNLQELQL